MESLLAYGEQAAPKAAPRAASRDPSAPALLWPGWHSEPSTPTTRSWSICAGAASQTVQQMAENSWPWNTLRNTNEHQREKGDSQGLLPQQRGELLLDLPRTREQTSSSALPLKLLGKWSALTKLQMVNRLQSVFKRKMQTTTTS